MKILFHATILAITISFLGYYHQNQADQNLDKQAEKNLGVIMIGTPPNFPQDYAEFHKANWEEEASKERKN